MQRGLVLAEPLQLILSQQGHPNAHEKVRLLTLEMRRGGYESFMELIAADADLRPYFEKMTPYTRQILADPARYTGLAAQKAKAIAYKWAQKLGFQIK